MNNSETELLLKKFPTHSFVAIIYTVDLLYGFCIYRFRGKCVYAEYI